MSPKKPRQYRLAVIATSVATIVAVVFVVLSIDFNKIVPTLRQLRPQTITAVIGFLFINMLLAYFRFERTFAALGVLIGWRTAARAFVLSTLAGQFLLNIVGQSLTRAVILQSAGVPMSLSVVATYLERLATLGVLGIAAVIAALYLFGSISFDTGSGGAYFLSLAIAMAATLGVAGARAAAAVLTREHIGRIAITAARLTPAFLLNVLVFAAMFGAYFVLALDFAPQLSWPKIAAALVIVMFAAGMPISWAGWGLREFGAVYALGAIGMPSEAAVVIAVTVGTLGLLTSLLAGAFVVVGDWRRPQVPVSSATIVNRDLPVTDVMLFWSIGILAACLIYFQVLVPTPAAEITVNVADPLALTSFFFAAYFAWKSDFLGRFPRPVVYGLAAIAGALILGAVVAWFNLGLTQWALLNRLLGFLVLTGYACVGGLVMQVAGERGRTLLAEAFVLAGLVICTVQIIAYATHLYAMPLPVDFFGYQFKVEGQLEGYAQNPNAFAFQLLMAMCVLFAWGRERSAWPTAWALLGIGALVAVVLLTRSRAGIVCAIAIMAMVFILPLLPSRLALNRTAVAVLGVGLVVLVLAISFHSSLDALVEAFNARWRGNAEASNMLRWQTVTAGIQQWLQHPVLGGGLGSFLLGRQAAGLPHLVIHSDPIWFLAEMGIVGLLAYLAFIASLVGWTLAADAPKRRRDAVLVAVAVFVLMGLVHDIFFQRTFWFALGLMLTTAAVEPKSR